jgi:hypothetical protein
VFDCALFLMMAAAAAAARRLCRHAQRLERDALALQYRERRESKRRGLLADPLRFTKVHPELWSSADVLYWLKSVGLAELTEVFACNDLEGVTLMSVSCEPRCSISHQPWDILLAEPI